MLNNIKPLIILFLILLTLSTVQATSLGVIKRSDYVEIKSGETKILKLLLWNTEKTTQLNLKVKQLPEKWNIFIRPNNFMLNKSKPESPPFDKDVEYLNLPEGIVKTYPVKVYVNIPRSAEPGIYEVLISANTGNPSKGISVSLERTLRFTVNVTGRVKTMPQRFLEPSDDTIEKLTGMASAVTEQGNVLLIFVSTVTVIGISWIIKRLL